MEIFWYFCSLFAKMLKNFPFLLRNFPPCSQKKTELPSPTRKDLPTSAKSYCEKSFGLYNKDKSDFNFLTEHGRRNPYHGGRERPLIHGPAALVTLTMEGGVMDDESAAASILYSDQWHA